MRRRRWLRRAMAVAAVVGGAYAALVALAYSGPLPERLAARPSTVVTWRDGTFAHVFLSADEKWRIPLSLQDVDPAYVKALLALEDRRFYSHHGVDPLAVARAAVLNVRRGRRVSGASTLTMQLVRMLEPRPRTWSSKLVEAVRAIQLEVRLSKEEILVAYLQHVPYGGNVEGIEAASWAYFGHRATSLSAAEIATLLAVPQNPRLRAPSERNAERLRDARNAIAARLLDAGALSTGSATARVTVSPEELLSVVRETAVPRRLTPFPRDAPHAAGWLRRRTPDAQIIRTTLDRSVQRIAERYVSSSTAAFAQKDIHAAAAVVVDHATFEVRALVGGFDFWSGRDGAQIPAFDVRRSPGSTLKPFLYAEAIEKGLANPEQLVADVPVTFGGYAPKNYDGTFTGVVKLEDALSRSLNVPFVNLLQEIGVEWFLGQLRGMGVQSLVDAPGHYGLSAVVGGVELSPLELAGMYAALARGGTFRPLTVVPVPESEAEAEAPSRIFSEGAAWLTQRALSLKDRPDFPARRQYTALPRGIHWKTGTSFGNRDAWAAGSDARHTVVVWTGNLDNTATAELVGADAAGPLLFDLLEATADRSAPPDAQVVPRDLTQVEVCAYSGHLPGSACQETKVVLARRTAVPVERCPYHVAVEVEVATGRAVTPTCRTGGERQMRSFLVWPSQVRRWLKDQHRNLPSPPALAEGCQPGGPRRPPRILSPAPGQVALLLRGVEATRQEIPLEADAPAHARLSWFVDGAFLGTTAPEDKLWWTPRPGRHELVVSDDSGLSARAIVEVRHRTH